MLTKQVTWGKDVVELSWIPKANFIPTINITSAHALCFHEQQLLLVNIDHRGWDILGGHLETNETPQDCVIREVMEEGAVSGDLILLGAIEVNHSHNPNWSTASPYPKIGYQLFYRMDVTEIHSFCAIHESLERQWVEPKNVARVHNDWHDIYQAILDYASDIKTVSN